MKQYPKTKATGNLGVTFVESVVSKAGSIFRSFPEEKDVGIDGHIEFVDNQYASGIFVGIQIKSGSSYLVQYSDAKYFNVRVSNHDLNYWNSYSIPVAVVAYDPKTNLSGWLDVTGFIRQNPDCLTRKWTKLTIHCTANPFTVNNFEAKFKPVFSSYIREADIPQFANMMASHDIDKKLQGFLGLMSHPTSRFSELTCFLLINHLFHENHTIRIEVTDALSRYLPHPEVGFIPPETIRDYVVDSLEYFGIDEVSRLLETAWLDEENLMQRGSVGQSVGVIITYIPNFQTHLFNIAINPSYSYKARLCALALASEFSLDEVITNIALSFHKIDWGDLLEEAGWILEEYEQGISGYKDVMLEVINQNDINKPELVYILRDASLAFLVEYEDLIYKIDANTSDPTIKFEAQHALTKIINWRLSNRNNTN